MIAIIGGTGLYSVDAFQDVSVIECQTPFGASASITCGFVNGKRVYFCARHSGEHTLLPGEINYRANIWALKSLGVRQIISVSAVGSLQREIQPGDIALVDQYFDWTSGLRKQTFFREGLVGHINVSKPTCERLSSHLVNDQLYSGRSFHTKVNYGCIEGPRLCSELESAFLQHVGCQVVGMTNVPEAFLAREAQMCYASLCMVTDYACVLDRPGRPVTVDEIITFYKGSLSIVQDALAFYIDTLDVSVDCSCRSALTGSILSKQESLCDENRFLLDVLEA